MRYADDTNNTAPALVCVVWAQAKSLHSQLDDWAALSPHHPRPRAQELLRMMGSRDEDSTARTKEWELTPT